MSYRTLWLLAAGFTVLVAGCTTSRPPEARSLQEPTTAVSDSARRAPAPSGERTSGTVADTLLPSLRSAYVDGEYGTVIRHARAHRDDSLSRNQTQVLNTILGRAEQARGRHEAALTALRSARVAAVETGASVVHLDRALGESYAALYRWPQAASAFRRVLDAAPDDLRARLALAEVYRKSQTWKRAQNQYARLVRADSSRGKWWARLAQCELERNQRGTAVDHFAQAHRRVPQSVNVALSLSRLYRMTEQPEAARAVVDTTLTHQAGDSRLWRRKADLAFEQEDLQSARRAYRHTIAVGDSSATVYRRLGLIEVKQEQYAEALAPLRTSFRKDSRPPRTTLYLGIAYLKVDSLRTAKEHLKRTIDGAAGPVVTALSHLGSANSRQGDVPAAVRAYRTVLCLQSDRAEAYFRLATVYDEHYEEKTTAARHYRRFLRVSDSTQKQLRMYAKDRLRALRPTLHMETARSDTGM